MAQKPSNPNQKPGAFGNKVVREDVLAAFNRGDKAALVSIIPEPAIEPHFSSPPPPVPPQHRATVINPAQSPGHAVGHQPAVTQFISQKDFDEALFDAVVRGNEVDTESLLQLRANPNALITFGLPNYPQGKGDIETAFIRAGRSGTVKILALLANEGADINAQSKEGKTALMKAVKHDRRMLVETLINMGVDLTIRDNRGMTALGVAHAYCRTAISFRLVNAGGRE